MSWKYCYFVADFVIYSKWCAFERLPKKANLEICITDNMSRSSANDLKYVLGLLQTTRNYVNYAHKKTAVYIDDLIIVLKM